MTLLVNEIHVPGNLQRSLIVLAADRRVTVAGAFHSNRKKLFRLHHLNAGVGYFGLAMLTPSTFFSDWLPNIINKAADTKSLGEFANRLRDELNQAVDKSMLVRGPSGFHVCGFGPSGCPELWFIRNIGGMKGPVYTDFASEYHISEDFAGRDARKMGFDGTNPQAPQPFVQFYVNGDVRPFHASWFQLDQFLDDMFHQRDFKHPREANDLVPIVKWKMATIASFYAQFAKKRIIGTPIDAFVLLPTQAAYALPSQGAMDSIVTTYDTSGLSLTSGSTFESDIDLSVEWLPST